MVAAEEEILAFWREHRVFEKTLAKESPKGNFVFYEGPPTANGKPGIHHVLARVFKDALPRYKTMQGYHVERKAGWDTQGLPVELQVEKSLGISGKPQIEEYGVAEFNQKCRESVWQYQAEWEKLTERIAYWEDLEHPYITYHNDYIESLWAIIKKIFDRNLIYLGHKVVPHCPRCGTALSSHEVAQGYKLVKDTSVYVKCRVKNPTAHGLPENTFILAWTTTPWTLPGNVALAVGSDIDYVVVQQGAEAFVLAADRFAAVFPDAQPEVVKKVKGAELVGLEHEPLFAIQGIADSGAKAHSVVAADFVTTTDGTGVVHTAVMYGEDDYNLGEQLGLPKVHTVREDGTFTDDLAPYGLAGKFVKDSETEKLILAYLAEHNLLLSQALYEHDYPFCWRCDTPLLYYAKDSWFIRMTAVKDDLLHNAEQITWVPEHIKDGRFGEWLQNIKDWAISRERYWGTPLPIWKCGSCGALKCVGSAAELPKKLEDLHRPFIDQVTFDCACGGIMQREAAVLDCWFDSGAMPFAQYHYPFENTELIDGGGQFPADFICEAIDQTRGWFYTLLAISTLVERGASYRNVICLGHINDKFGKKMSKSKGNIVDPWEMIERFGVDAVRMHLYTINQPGEGKNYDPNDVQEALRKNIMLLGNVVSFYQMYATGTVTASADSSHPLDQWIVSLLQQLVATVTSEMDRYHVYEAAREIPLFIDQLSTWYIRRSRDRFKGDDVADKQAALQTTKYVLVTLVKIMAPFAPFVAERVYRELGGEQESVHLEHWPEAQSKLINEPVLTTMNAVRQIVEAGLAARAAAGVKIRQPLASYSTSLVTSLPAEYAAIVTDELNIGELKFGADALDVVLTPELKAAGQVREVVRHINALRKTAGLTIQDRVTVYFQTDSELAAAIEQAAEQIAPDVLANTLCNEHKTIELPMTATVAVDGHELWLGLTK